MKKVLMAMLACLLGLGMGAWADARAADGDAVRVTGAGSMFGRVHTLSRMFMKESPGIRVEVSKEANVDAGIAALLEGRTDAAMASRRLTDEEKEAAKEKNVELAERLIGHGGIVIVAHPSNPLNDLAVEEVRKIFKGEYTRWSQVGGADEPIVVFRTGSTYPGTSFFMENDFLGGPFSDDATVVEEFSGVMRKVASTPGSLGYTRIRDAFESPAANEVWVKVLDIARIRGGAAVAPSRATVKDGSYPVLRPYYLYLRGDAGKEAVEFTDFIMRKGWGQQGL